MAAQTIKSTDSKADEPTSHFSLRTWRSNVMKRAFDVVLSGLSLLILSPIFLLVSILIKRDSPGPVFFRGMRLGRGDKPFSILKFRSMREEAASYKGPPITAEDDPRITRLGKWLRDTKLNELPQLWNVLVGEMSLVGPRPEEPSLTQTWPPEVRTEVLSVRPGITSPASVIFRDEEKMLSNDHLMDTYLGNILPSKLRLDQLYVRHRSLLLDLDVLLWTFLVVLVPNLRQHKLPEETLFWGPISRLGRRYVNWFILDTLTTLIAFGLVGGIWRLYVAALELGLLNSILISVAYSIVFSSIAALIGVQKIDWTSASANEALELIPSTVLALLVILATNHWLALLPTPLIFMASALAFFGYVFTRYRSRILTGVLTRWVTQRKDGLTVRERVLIVGAGDTGQFAAWRLMHGLESLNLQVVGFVDDNIFSRGTRLNGVSILGKHKDIPSLVQRYDIGVIVFAIHNISAPERQGILKTCRGTPARVVTWPNLFNLIRPQRSETNAVVSAPDGTEVQPYGKELIESEQVGRWLDALETEIDQGDYNAVVDRIHSIRTSMQAKHPPETGKL
jgi:lipopolysaccharide/colanic/teichoic acid biosynthesis glycosyltransferase